MSKETAMMSAAKIGALGSITLAPRTALQVHIPARPI
jgi:hypothetical protein